MISPPTTRGDPCESIRVELAANHTDMLAMEEALNDDDIPESMKDRFRAMLERLKARRRGLAQALTACEARAARRSDQLATDRSDPCAAISEQLAQVDDEFFAATQELSQPDLTPERLAELEVVLARCKQLQILLLQALAVCELRPEKPIEA